MRQRNLARSTRRAKPMVSGKVDSQYFVGSFSPLGHSISSHSSGHGSLRSKSRWAMRMRSRAKRDLSGSFVPSRQVIVRHALAGRLNARSDRKSTRLNSSHGSISYAVVCLKKKTEIRIPLSQVRFNRGGDTWGAQFIRFIQRRGEEDVWSFVP